MEGSSSTALSRALRSRIAKVFASMRCFSSCCVRSAVQCGAPLGQGTVASPFPTQVEAWRRRQSMQKQWLQDSLMAFDALQASKQIGHASRSRWGWIGDRGSEEDMEEEEDDVFSCAASAKPRRCDWNSANNCLCASSLFPPASLSIASASCLGTPKLVSSSRASKVLHMRSVRRRNKLQ